MARIKEIESSSSNKTHKVNLDEVTCTCSDFMFRRSKQPKDSDDRLCKHLKKFEDELSTEGAEESYKERPDVSVGNKVIVVPSYFKCFRSMPVEKVKETYLAYVGGEVEKIDGDEVQLKTDKGARKEDIHNLIIDNQNS